MNWNELLAATKLESVKVSIIKPVRDGDVYKTGTMQGFKPGKYGAGYYWEKPGRKKIDSKRSHWIKKPKVLVVYNAFTFGKSEHFDWVDVDNCIFEVITES